MTILIIDTFKSELLEAERILTSAGLTGVRTAGTHHEAALLLGLTGDERAPFAVATIVLDITVGREGLDLFHTLRAHAFYRHVPVVMVASSDEDERLRVAFALGADDFVGKPYAPSELVARVRRAMRVNEDMSLRLRHQQELFEVSEEMAYLKRLLTRVMLIDPQTALASRRCFDESLAAEWRRSERSGKPLAVIAFGIDAFGRFNDQFGHQAGDACLRRIARAAQKRLARPGDVLARFGGGVFAALLPETGAEEALIVAENLRQAVATEAIRFPEAPTGTGLITISCGVATTATISTKDATSLVTHAEKGLDEAKQQGGNRIRTVPLSNVVRFKESA